MRDNKNSIYLRGSLEAFPFRKKVLIFIADYLFYFLISIIGKTLRIELANGNKLDELNSRQETPILTLWHNDIFCGTYLFRNRGIAVITSQSADGEYIARFLTRFGFGAIRGSSSRGGVRALVEAIKWAKQGISIAFTLDGPRGPRHIAKPGAVTLASKVGQPILPFVTVPKRKIELKTWDRLIIPLPFTKVALIFGEPIRVGAGAAEAELREKLAQLQKAMEDLTLGGERYFS
jgi:lysophospholipid acyltransferase (LPLAT)-like uncharacterized protein